MDHDDSESSVTTSLLNNGNTLPQHLYDSLGQQQQPSQQHQQPRRQHRNSVNFSEASDCDCSSGRRRPSLLSTTKLPRYSYYQVPHATSQRPSWYHSDAIQGLENIMNGNLPDQTKSCYDWLELFLPMCKWLKTYPWRTALLSDVIAGCTIGFMVVPQSLSYARLGGMPVQYGLYSSLFPIYAYACFGSSRQVAVGPVALVSLLLSTGLSSFLNQRNITPDNTDNYQDIYNRLAIQVSFLVGLVYVTMGLLRMGFLTNFLSHAVVSGFTTGAAVIIGASQIKYFVGYNIPKSEVLQQVFRTIGQNWNLFNVKTFVVGLISLRTLLYMKNMGKNKSTMNIIRALGPLTVTATSIILEVLFDLSNNGIPTVGRIPKSFPKFTATEWFPIQDVSDLFMVVVSISIVGFMESVAIAKKLAILHKYELDSSLELIGLGMANLAGAMFQSFPVTGSFSRSAVNNEAGAQSGISGIVTATIVLLVILFLTPVFEKVPLVILGSIVVSGVLGLLDFEEAKFLWKIDRFDFFVWLIAALGTMFLGVKTGLAISVGVSLFLVFYGTAYPHTAVLGRLPGTKVYRNVEQYPNAQTFDGILIVRIDAPIYFANTQYICDKLDMYEEMAQKQLTQRYPEANVKYVILEMSPVGYIDSTGLRILRIMLQCYHERGIKMCFSNPNVVVMDRFVKSGMVDVIGRDHIFVQIHDAVKWCYRRCSMRNEISSEFEL